MSWQQLLADLAIDDYMADDHVGDPLPVVHFATCIRKYCNDRVFVCPACGRVVAGCMAYRAWDVAFCEDCIELAVGEAVVRSRSRARRYAVGLSLLCGLAGNEEWLQAETLDAELARSAKTMAVLST